MMQPLEKLIQTDLEFMCRKAHDELTLMSGDQVWFAGGAGFLGYYLTLAIRHWNRLRPAAERIRMTVLDNFVRGVPAWLDELSSDEITLRKHDVTQPVPSDLPRPNWIIHAASIASPMYYRLHPLDTIDANVNGLRSMLDYAKERVAGGDGTLRGLLFFSTSEIYGDPPAADIPTPETFRGFVSCTGPRACYDESKRLGETLCVIFAQEYGVPVSMARPFNNYGPGLKLTDGRVLPDFARDVLDGRDVVMRSDGSPTRTFCYVADALVGYLKVLVRGRRGEPYNIGIETPEISMRHLADMVVRHASELWGYTGKVVHVPSTEAAYLVDNPNRRCPVITKARTEIGYMPEVQVEEGIRRTLNWYYFNRKGEAA
jgi:nucleoside-diphosphate-sugar epimerase